MTTGTCYSLSHDDKQDATGICLAKMDGADFTVPEDCGGIRRIVLDHLFRFFRSDTVTSNVLDIGLVPVESHFLP